MINLSEKELDFLIDLQHEMLTQDHICQAAPRFWVVQNIKTVPTAEEYSDSYEIFDDNGCSTVAYDIESFITYVNNEYGDKGMRVFYNNGDAVLFVSNKPISETESLESMTEKYYDDDFNEPEIEMHDYLDIESLVEQLNMLPYIYEEFRVVYVRVEEFIEPNTMFLTNRGAKEHIKANYYHYHEDAHSYAMTAWRSPEVKQLWDILDKINWKELKEEKYGNQNSNESKVQ